MRWNEMTNRFKELADEKTYAFAKQMSEAIKEYGEIRSESLGDYDMFERKFDEIYEDFEPFRRKRSGRIGDEYCVEEIYHTPEDGVAYRTFFSKKITLDEFYELNKIRIALTDLIEFYAFRKTTDDIILHYEVNNIEAPVHWTEYKLSEDTFSSQISRFKNVNY